MNDLFVFAAHNTVVTLALALFVYGLTRVWRNPPVAHVLWLLVLLKLVAPPVMYIDWSALWQPESTHSGDQVIADASPITGQQAEVQPGVVDRMTVGTNADRSATHAKGYDVATSIRLLWNRGRPVLLWVWLGGAALCAAVAATRIVRFERLLRDTLPAPERLQRLAFEIAGKLGVRWAPEVRYVECANVPLLWCAGRRATIVLPIRLVRQLDDQQAALILAHELAHLRRRDHWVRAVELIVSTVYWWNPLVWVIRRQIHQAEDLCCDAWVRWTFPDCTRRYAEVVFKTAESASASRVRARLLPASPFLHSLSLKARIEMILESRFAPRVSRRSMFVIALFAFLVLPSFVQTTKTRAWAGSNDEAPATPESNRRRLSGKYGGTAATEQAVEQGLAWLAKQQDGKSDTPTMSEFPYAVRFEQGATAFFEGDKITILEVRGTAETFTPGNIYWIKGTYTLASHDRATLAAYTTAMESKNGTGYSFNVQTTSVKQGQGTFTLFLPMSCRGWPHVSFYPAGGGGDFGGNYFGTGDSVLKQWWGSKEKDRKLTSAPAGSSNTENANDRHAKAITAIIQQFFPKPTVPPRSARE